MVARYPTNSNAAGRMTRDSYGRTIRGSMDTHEDLGDLACSDGRGIEFKDWSGAPRGRGKDPRRVDEGPSPCAAATSPDLTS